MKAWNFYTSNEIKPAGWLYRQLRIEANGLAGNLDKVWRDVRDSMWIGGNAEGWERVPYWLDGFIPLAYLLNDEDMIVRAQKYIDAIIENQRESGWICPCSDEEISTYDTWALQLISKVLVVYYNCSHDERVPSVIYKALKNYYELLSNGTIKLFRWGKFRWYETFIAIDFLYERYRENWILSLAKLLFEQGADYGSFANRWERPLNEWSFETHIVNIAMMLKSEAVSAKILGKKYTDRAERLYEILKRFNGTPTELFTGDECLSGISPIQGTELCAVVEQMYSYEQLYRATGDSKWAERLEVIAFNALPATVSDDMWTHQYVQLSNQISCERFPGKPIFRTNGKESHLFGLEPNYGCCTANFGQGWPKLALSVFMHDAENTVINVLPLPSELISDGKHIRIETEYPFKNRFRYTVSARDAFTFKIRIPSFAKSLKVNGNDADSGDGMISFDIAANETREIEISFDVQTEFVKSRIGLNYVKRGSLLFSVPIKYEKKMYEYVKNDVERKFPYCDYEYIPRSDWNYAYTAPALSVCENELSDIPFSSENPPITLKIKARKINWGLEDGYNTVCSKLPQSLIPIGDEEILTLYPYGCTKLRMTELPIIE